VISGAVWAIGALAVFLVISAPPISAASPGVELAIPAASALLAVFWGAIGRQELAGISKAKSSIAVSVLLFLAALVLLGWSFRA
jgi:hypothetical protein